MEILANIASWFVSSAITVYILMLLLGDNGKTDRRDNKGRR